MAINSSVYGTTVLLKEVSPLKGVHFIEIPLESSKYAWIYLNKVQNMHKLLLNNTWITCLKLTKYVYVSEYAWISHGFWICHKINEYISLCQDSENAWISRNIPECGQIYLNMSDCVNMAEYSWNISYLNLPEI